MSSETRIIRQDAPGPRAGWNLLAAAALVAALMVLLYLRIPFFGLLAGGNAAQAASSEDWIIPAQQTFDLQPDLTAPAQHLTLNNGQTLLNQGTMLKSAGSETAIIDGQGRFDNPGTLQVLAGTVRIEVPLTQFDSSTRALTGGTWIVDQATLDLPGLGPIGLPSHPDVIRTLGPDATVILHGPEARFDRLALSDSMYGNARSFSANHGSLGILAGQHLTVHRQLVSDGTLHIDKDSLLTITDDLILRTNSLLDYELAAPSSIALIEVLDDLVLDGTLNVTGLAGFGAGVYRLINYGDTLINLTLNLGNMPSGYEYAIDVQTPGQVNLLVGLLVPPDPFVPPSHDDPEPPGGDSPDDDGHGDTGGGGAGDPGEGVTPGSDPPGDDPPGDHPGGDSPDFPGDDGWEGHDVPEPASAIMLTLGGLMILRRRSRR